ncbi:MAG: transcription antitermination protein NusB [Candidatus Puniceispirillales bacterium]
MTETDDAKPDKSDLRPASIRRRAAARIAAVQTLYQQWGSGHPLTDVVVSFQNRFLPELLKEFKLTHLNDQHYTRLVFGVDARRANMDEHISAYLGQGWTMERINQIDRDILRLAMLEFEDLPDISARTIIAEYSAIADSWEVDTAYITAILDRLAHQFRPQEFA